MDAVTSHFEANPDAKSFIKYIPSISANTKAISEALKTIASKSLKDKTVYLLAAETSTDSATATGNPDSGSGSGAAAVSGGQGKVAHGCYVAPAAQEKGLDAAAWSMKVAEAVGGKAGGKGATSLGQGTKAESVDEAVEVAQKYLAELGI